jgi:SAM-dependent methyltransferase
MGAASILLVIGGEPVMRDVFRTHRIGYWSAAFSAVLERRGWIDFDEAEPEALRDASMLRSYDAIIIAWLPPRFWKPSYVSALRAYDGVLFVEGPVPPPLERLVGLERVEGAPVADTALAHLSDLAAGYPHPAARELRLAPRVSKTKPPKPAGGEDHVSAYDPAQVEAWGATPYGIERYRVNGAVEEITLDVGSESWPGVVRRGRVMASTFQLLGYLVHMQSLEPLRDAWADFESAGNVIGLESAFFHLLDVLLERHNRACLSVAPWPWGLDFGLSIRHDVDRIPDDQTWRRLRDFERSRGLGVTWFWLPDQLDREKLAELAEGPDEIALHAVRTRLKGDELDSLRAALPKGNVIRGEALHGPGDGRHGHPSVAAAVAEGLAYSDAAASFESFGHGDEASVVYDFPWSRYPALGPDGIVSCEDLVGIRYVASTDVETDAHGGKEVLRALAAAGWYCQILNHPDLNFERLVELVDALPKGTRADWTCAQVDHWWRASHRADNLAVERTRDTGNQVAFEVTSRVGVADLELRFHAAADAVSGVRLQGHQIEWCPDGSDRARIAMRVSLEPGVPTQLEIDRKRRPRFREVSEQIATDEGFLRVDDDYLLGRVSSLVDVVTRFTPHVDPLKWSNVADVGSAYGGFLFGLHLSEAPASSVGVDLRQANVDEANRLRDLFGLENIRFLCADMTTVDDHVEGADVMIVANAIYFLPSRKLMRKALAAFYRALVPGGGLVLMTPNRLYFREATTELVGVQWLPRKLATPYVRARGRRATYDDVRLPSPFELRRWASRIGFEQVRVIDPPTLEDVGLRRHFKPRFYLTAVKPTRAY